MDTIKQVAITGSAVGDYMGGGARKTRRGRRAVQQMGGDEGPQKFSDFRRENLTARYGGEDPAPLNVNSGAKLNIMKTGGGGGSGAAVTSAPPAVNWVSVAAPAIPASAPTTPTAIPATPSIPSQQGGKPKIFLAPKQKTKKVILAAKHQQKLHLPHKKLHKQTIRRVCLPINVIKTKIAKTRKHIKDSQSMSIDKIRKELVASKLLNPASKAPDTLLRKIYADVKIIGTN
jgi:hypothetical protein